MLTTHEVARRRLAFLMSERARKIGGRLLERRNELGLSRPQMARRFEEASVTDDYLYRWETGKVEPSDAYMPGILRAYELDDVGDLYAGPLSERPERPETPDLIPALATPDWAALLLERTERIETKLEALLAVASGDVTPDALRDELEAELEQRVREEQRAARLSAADGPSERGRDRLR